jgi:hypothetical protein
MEPGERMRRKRTPTSLHLNNWMGEQACKPRSPEPGGRPQVEGKGDRRRPNSLLYCQRWPCVHLGIPWACNRLMVWVQVWMMASWRAIDTGCLWISSSGGWLCPRRHERRLPRRQTVDSGARRALQHAAHSRGPLRIRVSAWAQSHVLTNVRAMDADLAYDRYALHACELPYRKYEITF